ncbi:M4 family metallopeptidase [Lysobacter claricitrinus]|uniref:M4 family metallopeptidase n=1 Tax=Lysobacter claricitrinus TaxID=3367728 RepID=UPI0038B3941D
MALSPLVLALAAGSAGAATRIDLHQLSLDKAGKQYKAATATLGVAAVAKDRHAELIGMDSLSSLKQVGLLQDRDGTTHYRYQQTFRGIPVFGENIAVAEQNGNVKSMFGRKVDGLAAEIPAGAVKFTSQQALDVGKRVGLGQGIAKMATRNEKSELMIYVDDAGHAHRAYVVSYFADRAGTGGDATRPFIIVDAQSGAVLKRWEGLTTALVGTGPGGNAKTGQYEWGSGGRYGYLDVAQSGSTCTMNNTNVKSVNLNGGTTGTTAYSYTCPRNTYKAINGAYSPINDAHFFGGVITNMYPAYTGYNALSFQLVMRVHYSSAYENAFWDGSTMSFGDGASTFYPLVSADVAGHEVSHGFTEQHSNLTYSGQSGGMNEAFSDMGGEATEYYWKGSSDFNVGTEIFKSTGALRYMCNPTQDGGSIDNAANYNSGLDVHYSSGVYNKAFCTLAKTAGWSVPTAFKVFARANAVYWTASSTFNSGACGVETAATDLGLNKADVTAAFNVVGVSCSGGGGGGGTTAMTNGTPITGISGAAGSDKFYSLAVPSGATNLVFTTSGGTGDVDLYVKAGSAPTTTSYTCKSEGSATAETCTIAAPVAGTYYVLLHGYATYSGVTLKGSYTTGGGGGGGTVLTSGVPVSLPSVATGGVSSNYTLSVPAGKTSVVFTISGGTGDADLYVKLGSAPTTSSYTCRPYLSGNAETCTINAPAAGTYYVNVRAYAAYSGVTLKGTIN